MRTGMRHLVPWSLLLLLLSACGGGGEEEKEMTPEEAMGFAAREEGAAARKKPAAKKGGPITKKGRRRGETLELKANPAWDKLAPHFSKFTTQLDDELHSKTVTWRYRDAFKSNMDKFFAPVEKKKAIVKKEQKKTEKKTTKKDDSGVKSFLEALKNLKDQPVVVDKAQIVPTEPLLIHPLTSYRFQIIMSGVSNPEVLVEDPDGKTHIVRINDRIGSEGGFVKDILKQDILVQVPEVEKPVIVSLAPPIVPVDFATP